MSEPVKLDPNTVPFTLRGLPDPFRKPTTIPGCFASIDFETADRESDSACAVGVVRVEDGKLVARETLLIRPPRQEFLFTHIHGLTWANVENERVFADVWPMLMPLLDGIEFLAAHNARFDRGVLAGCCKAHNLTAPVLPWQCTLEMARNKWRREKNDLASVCQRLGIALNHHEAGSDAEACARVLLALSGPEVKAA